MNARLFAAIMCLSAITGICLAFEEPAPVNQDNMELYAEIEFHCERLKLDDPECGICDRMNEEDRRQCHSLKTDMERYWRKYIRHEALLVLEREVELYLLSKSANSMADQS